MNLTGMLLTPNETELSLYQIKNNLENNKKIQIKLTFLDKKDNIVTVFEKYAKLVEIRTVNEKVWFVIENSKELILADKKLYSVKIDS